MLPDDLLDLGESFKRYFEIVPAVTEELRREAFRIRHQVYCEELGYEPLRADGLEVDEYDDQSLHCLIRSVATGAYAGCTRLVLTRSDDPSQLLPFEKICAGSLDRSLVGSAPLSEASFDASSSRPRFPYITVGLYLGTIELAALHGIQTLFVLTEPRLAKQFARLGVQVERIGREIEHRGTRVPSMLRVANILQGLNFIVRPLYEVIAQEVRMHLDEVAAV